MSKDGSYRQILHSSSVIGGASVINVLLGLLRMKVAAVVLGPAGVGLIGLLTSLAGTASALAGLGFGTVGTRQIAEVAARNDEVAMAAARRALFWGTLVLALIGAAVFWALSDILAVRVLGDASLADEVGWLALVVALTVAAASQTALLNGMRRIADLARASIGSALLSALLGIGALILWGQDGLMIFVIATPLASFLLGHLYVARLPRLRSPRTPMSDLVDQWRTLVTLGSAFMLAGLVGAFGQLAVRTVVQSRLGVDALGYFQSASTLSMTYIGFVLAAMGTDYYPRLAGAMKDHAAVNRMVNEQTEVALLLAGPVFLLMMGFAPWVIEWLYSDRFLAAVDVLRWQVLGDVLKVASWPLGFVILAAGDGRSFMLTESLAVGVFVLLTWLGIPFVGLVASGMAFWGMYALYLPLVYWLAWRKTKFRWAAAVWRLLASLLLGTAVVFGASSWSTAAGAIAGGTVCLVFGVYGFGRLAHKASLTGPLGQLAGLCRKVLTRAGLWRD